MGGRVVYPAEAVMDFGAESGGLSQSVKQSVLVSAPKYKNDPERFHVSIMFPHPHHADQKVRIRKVTPEKGWTEKRAKEWGMEQGYLALGKLKYEKPTTKEEFRKIESKEEPKKEVPTLGELWERHIMTIKNPGSRGTRRCEWRAISSICETCPVDSWTKQKSAELQKLIEERFDAGYGNHCISLLRKLFALAVTEETIEEIPRLPPSRTVRAPEPEDAHSLEDGEELLRIARKLGAEKGEDLELLFLIGLDAGLRPGEVAGLRWIDVDLKRGCLSIRNQRPRAGASDRAPKNKESRKVFITSRLKVRLEARREVCQRKGFDGPYVLGKENGDPLYTQAVSDRVARIHALAGLGGKRRRGHHLRHCSASWTIFGGGTLTQVQRHLGHKRASTTEQYIHQVKGSVPAQEVAAILDRVHGNGLPTHGNAHSERPDSGS